MTAKKNDVLRRLLGELQGATPEPMFVPRLYTEWEFLTPPTHPGVYAVRDPKVGYAKWDGHVWYGAAHSVVAAEYNTHISDVQQREWCGLTEEAYRMMRGEPLYPPHQDDAMPHILVVPGENGPTIFGVEGGPF